MEYNNSYGITAWLDPRVGNIAEKANNEMLAGYKMLADKNKLTAHVSAVVLADANLDPQPQIAALKALQQQYNQVKDLSILGFKIFADGVVENPTQTAALETLYQQAIFRRVDV